MRKWSYGILYFAIAVGSSLARADDAKPEYSIADSFKIGGDGGWDYAIVDPDTHYLYTTRQTHLQVIDTDGGDIIADLPKCGAHGVALVPKLNKGFTSDGNADTVTVFFMKSNTVQYTVPTGHNPDCIIYDPGSNRVFAFDGKSNDATVIDPTAATPNLSVIAHMPLDGKPEFAAADGSGHVFVNIEDKNEIQDIDSKAMTVDHTWKIDGQGPTGLAIDAEHHHLFAGCDGKMVVVDTITGKTISTPPIGDGVDACAFNPTTHEAFASCGDGTLAVIRETSPGKFETVQTVKTKPGARTMALDTDTSTIYLGYGEMLPKEPGEKRAKIKPDTFSILVVNEDK
jgi:DNA-binding beta-propeller fold protein YncE